LTMNYTPVIGLEIHIEPNSKTKMFCACPQDHFGKKPNTQTCPVCLGLPGALPYANFEAIKKTVLLGMALGCTINKYSNFYRKHYFYPDLPKGFQTSQKDHPLCLGGELMGKKLDHIHLEEDAGKLMHEVVDGAKVSLVDFNRSGCALIELVTQPVFSSTDEVLDFVKELQLIARYLDISGADMEKGTMRLEANVSLRPEGSDELPGYKVELKNINSFRYLINAINVELKRQKKVLEENGKLKQETRGYDENKKTTFSQRSKEESQDYRYFPEADLPPIILSSKDLEKIKKMLPELPAEKRKKFVKKFELPENYSDILAQEKDKSEFYEEVLSLCVSEKLSPKEVANLIINKGLAAKNANELVKKAKSLLNKSFAKDSDVQDAVNEVLKEQIKAVADFRSGKTQVIGFLMGQVQKKLKGAGDPSALMKMLQSELKK